MLYKLQTLIGELHSWLACTVFGGWNGTMLLVLEYWSLL